MNAIHIVCKLSKYCSSRSEVFAAILKFVSAVEIILRMTSKPISINHFPILLKNCSFWIQAFLVNLSPEDTPKILDRMRLQDSKRIHLYTGGAQNGVSALVLSTIPLLPLFQLWPKLRTSDSLVCPNSSLPHNSANTGSVSINYFSQFHWGNSILVPWASGSWRASSSSFSASVLLIVRFLPFFLWFFLSLCIGTHGKWWPWAIPSS